MLRRLLLFIILSALMIPAFAQEQADIPLIAIFNDQIYRLQGDSLVPYDACMPDEQMLGQYIQSPDGLRFIIVTRPKIIQQALVAMGSLGDIAYGNNLWLCDTTTDTVKRILIQPNADNNFTGNLPSSEEVESNPAWSPDGTKLAWTKLVYSGESQSVVLYDIATDSTQEMPVVLPPAPFPAPPELVWNDAGIFLSVFTLDETTYLNVESLYAFDAASGTIGNGITVYKGGENDDYISERVYVHQGNSIALALRYYNSGWKLLDLTTGEQTSLATLPELYNPSLPDSVALQMDIDTNSNIQWAIANSSNPFKLPAYPFKRVALAPDGTGFAYADSVLHIWRNGQIMDIANSDGFADDLLATVLWLPKSWRVPSAENAPSTATPVNCEGAPQSRLVLGADAITTINLNVRDSPSTSGEKLGEFLPDQIVSVVNGPECADGYAWYFVQANGLMGWVAEGTGDSYFIAPVKP